MSGLACGCVVLLAYTMPGGRASFAGMDSKFTGARVLRGPTAQEAREEVNVSIEECMGALIECFTRPWDAQELEEVLILERLVEFLASVKVTAATAPEMARKFVEGAVRAGGLEAAGASGSEGSRSLRISGHALYVWQKLCVERALEDGAVIEE